MPIYILAIGIALLALQGCEEDPEKAKEKLVTTEGTTDKDGQFTGIKTTRFPSGKVWAVIPYKAGQREGVAKNYHENGTLEMEVKYHNGMKEGAAKRYFDNGNLYSETTYTDNKMDGLRKVYYREGPIRSKAYFLDGMEGIGLMEYNKSGEVFDKYPTIEISLDPSQTTPRSCAVNLSLSKKNWDEAKFYEGVLIDNKYLFRGLTFIKTENGKAKFKYPNRTGTNRDKMNIIASIKTPDGNQYVTQREFEVVFK